MKSRKRIFTVLLAVLMLITAIFAGNAFADNAFIIDMQAEDFPGSNIGVTLPGDCKYLVKNGKAQYALFDAMNYTFAPGSYVVVVYIQMVEKTGIDSTQIGRFHLVDTSYMVYGEKVITEASFPEAGKYYALQFPVTLTKQLNGGFRFWSFGNAEYKIDRVIVGAVGSVFPEPRQDDASVNKRPDGVEAVSEYTVPLTTTNLNFFNPTCGSCVNNTLEFRRTQHTVGGIKSLNEKFYLTSGTKRAFFYLRTPTQSHGESKLVTVTVLQGGRPIVNESYTADAFYDYPNQSYVLEYTFAADENKAMDVMLNWSGNFDLIVDKIVFTDQTSTANRQYFVNAKGTEGLVGAAFTKQNTKDVASIDTLTIRDDNIRIDVPASSLNEWFNQGYEEVKFTIGASTPEVRQILTEKLATYRATRTRLALFDLQVILIKADGSRVQLTSLQSPITVRVLVSADIVKSFGTGRKIGLGYQSDASGNLSLASSMLAADQSEVKVTVSNTGAYIIAVADLS